jgi:signal transduction histidine kinase
VQKLLDQAALSRPSRPRPLSLFLSAFRRWGGRLWRSAGLRFALLYAGLFGFSACALVFFLWWDTAAALDREVDETIRADFESLNAHYQEGGVFALIETINQRLSENVEDDAIYLLADPAGRVLAGNLDRWPAALRSAEGAEIPLVRDNIRSLARVYRYDLEGGYHLLVGRDVATRVQLRRMLTEAILWAILIVVGLGGLGAAVVHRTLQRMLAHISRTTGAIGRGDLSQRVALSGRGDEFDRLAETINDMLDRITRLMDGVRQVSNAIAHDLRTPITRARARLEDALVHAGGEADLRAAIERAVADLDAIVRVFQAILRIAEIESGARRSAFAPLDLTTLLTDLAEFYEAVAEERGLSLRVEVAPGLTLYGDRDMIQQAIANLLDNALKYSPPQQEIELRAWASNSGEIVVVVSDHGPGIPPEERSRVAERFYRGEAARNTPGAGLGLSLTLAIAELHDGRLEFDDNHPGLIARLVFPPAAPAA